ncbi:uncharacterized protein LOC106164654 [Lingula anatina]|uniref:Uncharacterized protein LOC106164654 n=1 Tax=Lingula anatina TaxID=7574 RepID=A0A1S3IJN1_LINAN|nr:uncharacterized protein LOC106164654 [Lingula anatina]|eukprot:XP_013398091.1 uncharacterized protein LOC106164654 [Lingula anatina]
MADRQSKVAAMASSEVSKRATMSLTPEIAAIIQTRERKLAYEKNLEIHINRGSAYPPMNLEIHQRMRDRVAGKGMTADDRLLRKKWVDAQSLAPDEPRFVPAPRNILRRVYRYPMDVLYMPLSKLPVLRKCHTDVRSVLHGTLVAVAFINFAFYCYYFKTKSWDGLCKFVHMGAYPATFGENASAPKPKYITPEGSPLL